jgi:hypothetical protein
MHRIIHSGCVEPTRRRVPRRGRRAPGLIVIGAFLATVAPTAAQQAPALALEGRHLIRLGIGMVDVTGSVSASVEEGAVVSSGIQLSSQIGYRYWFTESWAVAVDAGVLSMDSEVTASISETTVVSSTTGFLVFGARIQPLSMALGTLARPWFEVSGGGFSASTSKVAAFPPEVSVKEQTVPGARFAVGLDFVPHHRLLLSVGGRYSLLADFDEPVAGQMNMSHLEGELGVGILLGGGGGAP